MLEAPPQLQEPNARPGFHPAAPEELSCSVRLIQDAVPSTHHHDLVDCGRLILAMSGRWRPGVHYRVRVLDNDVHVLELEHMVGGRTMMGLMAASRPFVTLALDSAPLTGVEFSSQGRLVHVDGQKFWDTERAASCLLQTPALQYCPPEFLAALDLVALSSVYTGGGLKWATGTRRALRDLITQALVQRLRSEFASNH